MEERHFLITPGRHAYRIGKEKGMLKTIKIEEQLENGKRIPVHLAIRYETNSAKNLSRELFRCLRAIADKRRAA